MVDLARLKLASPSSEVTALTEAASRVASASTLPIDHETELVKRCFEKETLEILCGIRHALEREPAWQQHLTWALLGTLRDVASKKVGWPYQRPNQPRKPLVKDPRQRFILRAEAMASDLRDLPLHGDGRVRLGDSRLSQPWKDLLKNDLADACVSSPPYLNNFDYADATRLEVYFLGQAKTWKELCDRVRSRMLIASTQQTRVARAKRDLGGLRHWPSVEREAASIVASLQAERRSRPRGKEYDRVVPSYLYGIGCVLQRLRKHLRKGATCSWVIGDSAPYGVYIDTPRLISELAEDSGFRLEGSSVVRARGARWQQNSTRHDVQLDERLICFEAV